MNEHPIRPEYNIAPFYAGQKVVCIYTPKGSHFKPDQVYTISHCHYSENPANLGKWFWYVGIVGYDAWWLAPYIFAPIQENPIMTFIEISKVEKEQILILN